MNARTAPADVAPSRQLGFSAAAARRVRDLLAEAGNARLKLRLSVNGGGCAGFQYAFSLDEIQAGDDFVLERDGARLLVDPLSLPLVAGAEVDFIEDLDSARFVVRNLAASITCGCGASFDV